MSGKTKLLLSGIYKKAREDNLSKAAARQLTYEEIPKFPYGYYLEDEVAEPPSGKRTLAKPLPPWAPEDFKKLGLEFSFLTTWPTACQLRNLYEQVHKHFGKQSPLTLESEKKHGGVHSTRYPLPSSDNHDTYYIVRVRTYHTKRHSKRRRVIIEFLFKDSDNYLVAFRIIQKISDFQTAYWCLFSESRNLSKDVLFEGKTRQMDYSNAYTGQLSDVKLHMDFLDDAENFLRKLYQQPDDCPTFKGYLIFNSLYLMFGEAPRFALVADQSCRSVRKPKDKVCPIGSGGLHDLVKNWRSLSFTTLLLKLVLVEKALLFTLDERPSREFFEEMRMHEAILSKRFVAISVSSKSLKYFTALKQETERIEAPGRRFTVAICAPGVRGEMTLNQLTSNFLCVLRFDEQVVPGIIARMAGFDGALRLKLDSEDNAPQ